MNRISPQSIHRQPQLELPQRQRERLRRGKLAHRLQPLQRGRQRPRLRQRPVRQRGPGLSRVLFQLPFQVINLSEMQLDFEILMLGLVNFVFVNYKLTAFLTELLLHNCWENYIHIQRISAKMYQHFSYRSPQKLEVGTNGRYASISLASGGAGRAAIHTQVK